MLTRDQALELLQNATQHDISLRQHCLQTEAVMRGLATHLGQDPELWGVTGLLHDLDFPKTKSQPEQHGLTAAADLDGQLPPEALYAIQAHNDLTGVTPQSAFDFALRCGETVTGLVAANALVRPNGMDGMKPKSLKKKMKDKAFARNVNREIIKECDRISLDLGQFLQIAIDSITEVADDVGLGK
jgi:putative nucleotidyltransferase with HDIG domain